MIILFGSAARRGIEQANDIDIAVSGPPALYADERFFRLTDELEALFEDCHKELDVVPIKTEDPVLLSQIAEDGQLLYEAFPDAFSRFKLFARFYRDDQARFFGNQLQKLREELHRQFQTKTCIAKKIDTQPILR
jgi:predicted nucleotidyltransferase